MSTTSNSKEINAFHEQLEGFTSQEHLRSRKSQQLLLQIAEGLQTVPKLEIFMTKDHKEIPKVTFIAFFSIFYRLISFLFLIS